MADDFPDFVKFEGFAGQAWYHQHMREKRILRRAREFTPERLLEKGEQGVWYDPSDTTTLFQDSAGTTPVTASGQPVGLMLDKSKGLVRGPELVVNGGFDDGLAGWTAYKGASDPAVAVEAGKLRLVVTTAYAGAGIPFSTAVGSSYELHLEQSGDSGQLLVGTAINSGSVVNTIALGMYRRVFVATTTTTWVSVSRGAVGTAYFDNISVRELPGNHATQPTAASRPIYRRGDSRGVVNLLLNSSMALGTEGATPTSWTGRGLVTFKKSGNVAVLTSGGGVPGSSDDARQTLSGLTIGAAHTITFRARKAVASTQTTMIVVMTGVSTSILGLTDTFQEITLTTTPTGTIQNLFFGGASGLVAEITDVQVNLGPTALDYQRNDATLGGVATGASTDLHWRNLDGVDDNMVSAAGGGGTTGFFLSQAVVVTGGTTRTLWSDAGTNTGYRVRINSANKLELSAGNGSAFTTVATTASLTLNKNHLITAWDDGANLNVQLDGGAIASVARPVVVAGTAGFTMGKNNTAASDYFAGFVYGDVYRRDTAPTTTERLAVQKYLANKAAVTL